MAISIIHERGYLQTSIGLVSKSPNFPINFLNFLTESANLIATLTEITLEPFLNITQKHNIRLGEINKIIIEHPIQYLTDDNYVSTLFRKNYKQLLSLWRARVLGNQILIKCTNNVNQCTKISYFINLMSFYIRPITDCAYNIDVTDESIIDSGKWKVAAIANPIIQNVDFNVVIGENGKINFQKSLDFIEKGGGLVLKTIKNAIKANNDFDLLNCFILLSKNFKELVEKFKIINEMDLFHIGLDAKNYHFLREYIRISGKTTALDFNRGYL